MQKLRLPQARGRQVEVLCLPAEGHTVVLGTAGSGKTILAMLRAVYLATPGLKHSGKVLLLAYNNTLLRFFESYADVLAADIDIRTYAKFALGYLSSAGQPTDSTVCKTDQRQRLLGQAVVDCHQQQPSAVLRRKLAFLDDEVAWLMQHGVTSLREYQEAERAGRGGARLQVSDRPAVWSLHERYRELRASAGKLYDWHDIATTVLQTAQADTKPRRYRHIVIDEGQDFSPMMLRSLAALVPPSGSLTFLGDMAQQIYGNKISWTSAGLRPPKVWYFQENYRNTRQIAALALAIANMDYFKGTPDLVSPIDPDADGPRPALVSCSSHDAELAFVAGQAIRAAQAGSVAVLTETREEEDALARLLPQNAQRLHKEDLRVWTHEPQLYYGTFASAKGLEFDTVILPRLSAAAFPSKANVDAYGVADAAARAGKHLYVGVTRARSTLLLTYVGQPSALLPPSDLYDRASVQ